MNICFVTSEYVSPLRGGVERVTYILSNAFRDKGLQTYVVSKLPPLTEIEKQDNNYVFPTNDISCNIEYLAQFVKKRKIDFVINNSHHADMLEICSSVRDQTSCKLISVYHTAPNSILMDIYDQLGALLFNDQSVFTRTLNIALWLLRYPYRYFTRKQYLKMRLLSLYNKSDASVLLSSKFYDDFVRLSGLTGSSKLYAIGNPIVSESSAIKTTYKKEKRIVFVGRMCFSAKRPDRMVKIWESLCQKFPDWTLYMLGDGPAKNSLMAYCDRKGVKNIVFTGTVNPTSYYESASILCVTSTYEGFGLVLIEALNNSVIPMAFNSFNSVSDIIEDKINGFLIKPFSLAGYANALSVLMSDESLRERIRENIKSTEIKKQFEIDAIVQKWITFFEELKQ